MSRSLLVVAGEVSGDMHAAAVVRAIRAREPAIAVFGIGGDELRDAGAEILFHIRDMAVFGPIAVLRRYGHFRRVFREMVRVAGERRPDAVLLVDYGGFNLRFAARLKKQGLRILYYISPQVWASRRGRIRRMAESVDRLMVIFPFEPAVYAGSGLAVDFVGHPFVDVVAETMRGPEIPLPWADGPRVAVLPGSRVQEIDRILPVMLQAARILESLHPSIGFLVASPNAEIGRHVRDLCEARARHPGLPASFAVVDGLTRNVLRQADAAMVASGSATVETALLRCPMVIVYRASALFFAIARRLVHVPFIGMVNLIAGRLVCPELIQNQAQPGALATALLPLLEDTADRKAMVQGFEEVAGKLGPGGAANTVAETVLRTLRSGDCIAGQSKRRK